ncbi:MAG: enoyl-CoA hydratase/isomerase family protein [Alphaproteobacteria bacterium]|nr:enoyl-CoA hydratase/isomerase family protein [Alphaproteobacteria bacterium]MCW5742016.1 enoyl-CoA hydratase/isomerase family protein [Alphaproteobacteria bacterium]
MSKDPVLLEVHADGVAHVRLNRPEVSNGLDMALLEALHQVLLQVHGDKRVRAVLLTGEGKNFCAGGDVRAFLDQGDDLPYFIRVATARLGAVATTMIGLNAPVVAAVQGFAAGGGGMGLVCSADLVVAGESTKFLTGATRVAMVPDAGVSVTLTQLVGLRKAMELLMLNSVVSSAEALAMGLINRIVPDDRIAEEGLALARQLAQGATAALAATKRLLWSGLGGNLHTAVPAENQLQSQLCATADAHEGLTAVVEKRAPRFRGL